MTTEVVLYATGVVFLAGSLQGITGFGFMMICLPGFILRFPAGEVVPALLIVWLPLGTAQFIQLHREVDWKLLGWLVGSSLFGLPLGALILKNLDTSVMQRLVGALMVATAVLLQVKPGKPFRNPLLPRICAGFLSGMLGSATSMSGPPLVILGIKQQWESGSFRATLLTYFLAISLLALPVHWGMGLLKAPSVYLAIAASPGAFAGFIVGAILRGRVQDGVFRWITLGMVLGGGLAAIIF